MDLDLRQAQRAFLTGDVDAGLRVVHHLLRSGQMDTDSLVNTLTPMFQLNHHNVQLKTDLLALAFQTQLLDDQAAEALIAEAYPRFRPEREPGNTYSRAPHFNVFLDQYPVASLELWSYADLARAWPWLYQFYTTGIFQSKSREIFDVALQERVTLPPENILLTVSAEPPFDTEKGRPIPPRNYDPYVSFYLVDSFEDIEDEPSEDIEDEPSGPIPHWMNCYEVGQSYGGPEEGGWYRDVYSPLATMSVGHQEEYMGFDDRPAYVQEASTFLSDIYDEDTRVSLQEHSMQYYVYPEGGYE